MTYTSTMSAALFVFSQNEKCYKEFEVNHVVSGTLVCGVLFCGLEKGASLGRYFRKDAPLQADELEMQSVMFHEWIEPLCKGKDMPFSMHLLGKGRKHELNLACCAVGQWSNCTTITLLWRGLHLHLEGHFWQSDEMFLRVLCWQ